MSGEITVELKRLAFVTGYIEKYGKPGISMADRAWRAARAFTPKSIEPLVQRAESTVVQASAPAVTLAQDGAFKLLQTADKQVDTAVDTASKMLNSFTQQAKVQDFTSAASYYFHAVSGVVENVASRLDPSPYIDTAVAAMRGALETAKNMADPDKAVEVVSDAWATFSSVPPVASVLKTMQPMADTGLNIFYQFHDALVVHRGYKAAVDAGLGTLGWAASTAPGRIVLPVISPVITALGNSKHACAVADYWTPKPVSAAPQAAM